MTQNLFMKQQKTHRHRTDLWLPREWEHGGGIDWEAGVSRCQLLYTRCMNNKALLHSTGNSIQYPVKNHNVEEYEEECVSACAWLIHFAVIKTTL